MIVRHIDMLVIAICRGPERRNFDHLTAKADMCQPEPPPDEAAVAEQGPDLFGVRVSRNIEVLRMQLEQRITYPAAYQKRLKSRLVPPVQDFERALGNFCPRYIVGRAGNDFGLSAFLGPAAFQ